MIRIHGGAGADRSMRTVCSAIEPANRFAIPIFWTASGGRPPFNGREAKVDAKEWRARHLAG
jgi:hypothetical protein